jgi:uncharacterized repeat protein (TIGR01451 family)
MFMIFLHSSLRGMRKPRRCAQGRDELLRREARATAMDNRRRWYCGAVLLVAVCFGPLARAAEQIETTLVAEVREETNVAGRRVARLVPATVLREGQVVFYTVRILNRTSEPAREVAVVQRVPENTAYVPKSAGGPGAEIMFSADGGQTFGKEGQLIVVEQSLPLSDPSPGTIRQPLTRPATPEDYTHIRWRLRNPLAPGAVALARFRAVFK